MDRNMERDKENIIVLQEQGWKVLTVWECETKKKNIDILVQKLISFLVV